MNEIENQLIDLPLLKEKGISLSIKREDKIHPLISGNKYRKLKYNILNALEKKENALLTFGGAFSNHISAVASAGKENGFRTIGVIRGDELGRDLERTLMFNPTLRLAKELGMELKFISRQSYRLKDSEEFIANLKKAFGDFYLLPEGGTNLLAIKGCEEILKEKDDEFDFICSCVGTGGTVSGLINSSKSNQRVLAFAVLQGDFLIEEIEKYTIPNKNWSFINAYHFGGYAKVNEELINFINNFKIDTKISLDPIYTGKMMYGLIDLIRKDFFFAGTKILAIHTGGLQGIEGMNIMLKQKNKPFEIL